MARKIIKKKETYYDSLSDLKKKGQSILKKKDPFIKEDPSIKKKGQSVIKKKDPTPIIREKAPTPKPSFAISSNITKRRQSTFGSIIRRK